MNVKCIGPQTKKVVSATRETVQQRTHNPVNTYEFLLGFIPEKHPLGKKGDADIERIIDSIA